LAGRSSGQYAPNNPFWFKRNNPYTNIGHATVADSVDDTAQPRCFPQQAPLGTSQYYTSPTYRSMPTMDEQRFGSVLSQDAIQKVQELKRLVYKYPQFHNNNPDEIIWWAVHGVINGNNKFLNEKVEQLRSIDRRLNGWS